MADRVLENSEQALLTKIQEVNIAMKNENDPEKLVAYANALSTWLGAIEKIRRLRSQSLEP